jgi:NADH-quinone oxidoreductase subunit E
MPATFPTRPWSGSRRSSSCRQSTCTRSSPSCALLGGYKTCETFEKEFNTHAGAGHVSPDGEVTVEFVECLASCGTAPVVMIDDDLHEKVDVAKAKALSAQIKVEAAARR